MWLSGRTAEKQNLELELVDRVRRILALRLLTTWFTTYDPTSLVPTPTYVNTGRASDFVLGEIWRISSL